MAITKTLYGTTVTHDGGWYSNVTGGEDLAYTYGTGLTQDSAEQVALSDPNTTNGYTHWIEVADLDTSEIPAGSTITSVKPEIRLKRTNTQSMTHTLYVLYNGTTLISGGFSNPSTTALTVKTISAYTPQEWQQDLSKYAVRYNGRKNTATDNQLTVDWISLIVTYEPPQQGVVTGSYTSSNGDQESLTAYKASGLTLSSDNGSITEIAWAVSQGESPQGSFDSINGSQSDFVGSKGARAPPLEGSYGDTGLSSSYKGCRATVSSVNGDVRLSGSYKASRASISSSNGDQDSISKLKASKGSHSSSNGSETVLAGVGGAGKEYSSSNGSETSVVWIKGARVQLLSISGDVGSYNGRKKAESDFYSSSGSEITMAQLKAISGSYLSENGSETMLASLVPNWIYAVIRLTGGKSGNILINGIKKGKNLFKGNKKTKHKEVGSVD